MAMGDGRCEHARRKTASKAAEAAGGGCGLAQSVFRKVELRAHLRPVRPQEGKAPRER